MTSTLTQTIRARRTDKVLGDAAAPLEPSGLSREAVDAMLETAGFAPMHYPAAQAHRQNGQPEEMNSIAPYRVYKLDAAACRRLLARLLASDLQPGKISQMLAAADALLQVTWLPEPEGGPGQSSEEAPFAGTLTNMEHIAAGSAAIQNLLLLATEAGLRSYWSSGGVLRGSEVFDWLGTPKGEILLGSVFLFPADIGDAEAVPGKLRDKRGGLGDWSVWRDVD